MIKSHLSSLVGLSLAAAAGTSLISVANTAAPAARKPDPKPGTKVDLEEALGTTQTRSPSEALAKMNKGRVGRNRYCYMPIPVSRQSGAAARRLRQLAKAQSK